MRTLKRLLPVALLSAVSIGTSSSASAATNLALNKYAEGSKDLSKLVDGDFTTSVVVGGSSFSVDLGSPTRIDHAIWFIEPQPYGATAGLKLSTSDDAKTWTMVFEGTAETIHSNEYPVEVDFTPPLTTRYFKWEFSGTGALTECQLYNSSSTTNNLALYKAMLTNGGCAFPEFQNKKGPNCVTDGDNWSGTSAKPNIVVDLGSAMQLDRVRATSNHHGPQKDFQVDTSLDNATWSKAVEVHATGTFTQAFIPYSFTPVSARYVKWTPLADTGWDVKEIAVYGPGGGAVTPPPTDAGGAGGQGGGSALEAGSPATGAGGSPANGGNTGASGSSGAAGSRASAGTAGDQSGSAGMPTTAGSGGSSSATAPADSDAGCSCSFAGRQPSPTRIAIGLLGGLAFAVSRKRRSGLKRFL